MHGTTIKMVAIGFLRIENFSFSRM